jgi:hypothetical protein
MSATHNVEVVAILSLMDNDLLKTPTTRFQPALRLARVRGEVRCEADRYCVMIKQDKGVNLALFCHHLLESPNQIFQLASADLQQRPCVTLALSAVHVIQTRHILYAHQR